MRYRPLLATAACVLAADVFTKAAAVALSRWMPIPLPGGWSLQVAHNYGVILGYGAGTNLPAVFAAITAAEIAFMLWALRYCQGSLWAAGLGLIIGGAAGNLGEHWIFGSSVDWIHVPYPFLGFDSLTFNLADVAALGGQVILLALLAFRFLRYGPASALSPRAVSQP